MDRSTETQYHHSVDILMDKYESGFISLNELERCLHWILDDIFECVEMH